MRDLTAILDGLQQARANGRVSKFAAGLTDEEQLLLTQHEFEIAILPMLERARQRLARARTAHDLKGIERAGWSIEYAESRVQAYLGWGAVLPDHPEKDKIEEAIYGRQDHDAGTSALGRVYPAAGRARRD